MRSTNTSSLLTDHGAVKKPSGVFGILFAANRKLYP